ncbi:hypothetical protein SAMN02745857_03739 [Andreprevotia lacus DSM 23236]|jgi:hypothetical protein|uniref:Uncharacterized protein n=1 Tax=Andreprevotia lacus DSM 23236 TaxID=1121001 RepID=A0A1W1XZ93_9NEIS|nr:hypothetical protein [Andreprevotia lacus]SMC29290.1 hypothetical protein SAMN02745857_03739 [Andreprevotia lacus DSM 23236]
MRHATLWLASICNLALPACAQTPADQQGQTITIAGKLVLWGSAPHVYPVLIASDGQSWQLEGLSDADALALQNQHIVVTGAVDALPLDGVLHFLPMLRLQHFAVP